MWWKCSTAHVPEGTSTHYKHHGGKEQLGGALVSLSLNATNESPAMPVRHRANQLELRATSIFVAIDQVILHLHAGCGCVL